MPGSESRGVVEIIDGPQFSLAWLRCHLASRGIALAPGDLVLTGTPLGLYAVQPGEP